MTMDIHCDKKKNERCVKYYFVAKKRIAASGYMAIYVIYLPVTAAVTF